jgi:hypothetical protein
MFIRSALGELTGRRETCREGGSPLGGLGLVSDLVQRDVREDRGLVLELIQEQLIRLVDRDGGKDDEREDTHQHVAADERPEQAWREQLFHSPS